MRMASLADLEFVEAVLDRRHIGVHQRQQRRLRAVKARQVEQRDAMLGGKRLQHRIEGVTVGEQTNAARPDRARRRSAPP